MRRWTVLNEPSLLVSIPWPGLNRITNMTRFDNIKVDQSCWNRRSFIPPTDESTETFKNIFETQLSLIDRKVIFF